MITTRLPSHQSYLSVDWQNPIDRTHQLNKGLVGWWLNVPHLQGGTILHDLAGENHGTLINSPTWKGPQGRLGGFGALDFSDGNNRVVNIGDPGDLNITGNITVSVWAKFLTGQLNRPLVARWGSDQSYLLIVDFSTFNKIKFLVRVSEINKVAVSANTYNDGLWHHYAGIFDSANVRLFVDGGVEDVTGDATSGPIDSPAQNVVIGNYNFDLTNAFNGEIDDIRIYNRALSQSEVAEYFQLSQQGYPGIFNRWQRRAYSIPAAGGPFPHFLRRSNSLSGGIVA